MKKVISMATALVLVAAMAVGGTLAWLTASDEVTNTFTVGNITLTLDEKKVENGTVVTGQDGKEVRTSEGNSYKVYPGAVAEKDPTVTVGAKSEECYVRMMVTVTQSNVMDTIFAPNGANLKEIFLGYNETVWQCVGNTEGTTEEGIPTRTYEFRYVETESDTVAYAETATKLPALFTQVKIPTTLTAQQLATLQETGFQINVEAHAIQAAGFENAQEAWGAFTKPVATP